MLHPASDGSCPMTESPMPCRNGNACFAIRFLARSLTAVLVASALSLSGCQDGPMYALKVANPYFSMKEWRADEKIGITDHQRRHELLGLASSIASLPQDRQAFWLDHLEKVVEADESPEMRRIAIHAAGRSSHPQAIEVVRQGTKDESTKVRMEACKSLQRLGTDDAALMLAETIGSETDLDVRHAAMKSLGGFQNKIAVDSLRLVLTDRNPATRGLAMESLRTSTGENYGDDPQAWIAALDGKPTEPVPTRIADRVRNLF